MQEDTRGTAVKGQNTVRQNYRYECNMYNLCRASYALNGDTSVYVHAKEHRLVLQTCSRVRGVPRVEPHRGKSRKHPLHAEQGIFWIQGAASCLILLLPALFRGGLCINLSAVHAPCKCCGCQYVLRMCRSAQACGATSHASTSLLMQAGAHLRGSTPFLMTSDVFQHEITP